MPMLFVDCDSTLVLWQDEPVNQDRDSDLWVRRDWRINTDLVQEIELLLTARPEWQLIVWSGGGLHYAAGWARRAGFTHPWVALAKDFSLAGEGDICIDDMEGEIRRDGLTVIHPDQFQLDWMALFS